jgi:hypothetical protein
MNRKQLQSKVFQTAELVLARQHYVSAMDVLIGIGLLQPVHVQAWREGQVPYLEKVIQGNLGKISFALRCYRQWATGKQLKPSQTAYLTQTKTNRRELQFSKSGDPNIECAYRTHYISPVLSAKKQQKIQEKLSKPPELVVLIITQDGQCSRCQKALGRSSFLYREGDQSLCLGCAGLDELIFLPSGNARLTRQVKSECTRYFVVLKFSRARKRYERQGLLVEEQGLEKARQKLGGHCQD